MLKIQNMLDSSVEIENFVQDKEMSYIDAVMEYISLKDIDISQDKIKNFLSPTIIQKLEAEAYELNLLKVKKQRNTLDELE